MQQSGRLDTFGKKQAMYYKVRFFVISHPIWSREHYASNVSLVTQNLMSGLIDTS